MSSQPSSSSHSAYCVRCRKQTTAHKSHTVVLQNGARALQGHCSECQSEVYRILEKKKQDIKLQEAVYPDAYCVKCKTNTPTLKGHTVILANDRRALRGVCPNCSSEIYKILPKTADYTKRTQLSKSTDLSRVEVVEKQPLSLAIASIPAASINNKSKYAARWKSAVKESALIGGIVVAVVALLYFSKF